MPLFPSPLGNATPTGYHIASHKDVIVAGATPPFDTVSPETR